jgi:uncharacterized DUF497 family protein
LDNYEVGRGCGHVEWLQQFAAATRDFDWDANRAKQRKHRVQPADIEGMFRARTVFLGRIVEPAHDEDRWLPLGQEPGGRRPALIFTRRGERLRPISCRSMRTNERSVYEEACKEDR